MRARQWNRLNHTLLQSANVVGCGFTLWLPSPEVAFAAIATILMTMGTERHAVPAIVRSTRAAWRTTLRTSKLDGTGVLAA